MRDTSSWAAHDVGFRHQSQMWLYISVEAGYRRMQVTGSAVAIVETHPLEHIVRGQSTAATGSYAREDIRNLHPEISLGGAGCS